MILRATGLTKNFGGLQAVGDLDFAVEPGEIFAIIGPNGAGKTTTLNLISGLLAASAGRIEFEGTDITDLASPERTHLGLGRAFQVVQPFPEMSVYENVLVGALFGTPGVGYAEADRRAREALARAGLERVADDPAEDLTLMQEKRLEIARALATRPRLLLLDEVMAGLRPAEARQAIDLVKQVRDGGVTIVFIEHVMPVVRDLADRVLVMDHGRSLARGSYAEVTADPHVIEAYLGAEDEPDAEPESDAARGAERATADDPGDPSEPREDPR